MMVAVELCLRKDPTAEQRDLERRAKTIIDNVSSIRGVQTEVELPEIANHVPHVHIWWDESQVKITVPEVVERLRNGNPSIEVTPRSKEHLIVNPWMLQRREVRVVARRIRDILKKA